MKTVTERKATVAHSVICWLPLTTRWIYNQVKYMMNDYFSIILANTTQNLDQFPWDPIYTINEKYRRLALTGLRKLGLKTYPWIYDTAINKHHPMILHSHFADKGWHDLPLAKKHGLKHVVTFYGYDVNMLPRKPAWKERYKKLFDRADLFLCEGSHMAKSVVNMGCFVEKVRVNKLGVEVDKIPFVPREISDDGITKILIAGTFREKKGIPYALEAIGILKGLGHKIRVTVIGESTGQKREEKEKRKILDVIKKYNLEPFTRMLGFVPHNLLMQEAYKHHIFLSPSVTASDGDTEGGAPVTIIEMSASGMPVISTWHCDIPEVIKDGVNGLLVKERDIVELVDAISAVMNQSSRWFTMDERARQHIKSMFDVKSTANVLGNIYNSLNG